MKGEKLNPLKALNKAYRKVKPIRSDINHFKEHLITLLGQINESESEEHHKIILINFLKKTYYDGQHYINTRGREDLVIHNGKTAKSTTGVIIEAKKPGTASGMIKINNLNQKALQELVLYYLRERVKEKNHEIKNVIVTDIYEWFIFDAQVFDKCFAQDKKLVKKFNDFEAGRLSFSDTNSFYNEIAKPAIQSVEEELVYTYFDIRKYKTPLLNEDLKDDKKLIALYKILSPQHLLKLPFANDSNTLDKAFYEELLHIIGLEEVKVKGKKIINRKKEGQRDSASLLENAILQLETISALDNLSNVRQYGTDRKEQLFTVGLELVIIWINRILFLKLLEAQLVEYHYNDRQYRFLNLEMLPDFDQLYKLFHQVLANKTKDRPKEIQEKYDKVPYLNSSLFEVQALERSCLMINQLEDNKSLPIYKKTVLKEGTKARKGSLNALTYLFAFLDAYDFASEGGEDIQEDNKNLINASVLGLIFEKINGYKDGSFFTPGFITMYMCHETIRKAVIQKFNEVKGWQSKTFGDLKEDVTDYVKSHHDGRAQARSEANDIINSIKIVDPAVGSGHFLVSSLNELIAIKNDLKILQDKDGHSLNDYKIEVVNDELIITDETREDAPLFEYHPDIKSSHRVQETLFHEKQTIIENCLFGVDINPNSVKICQLRLWIELLKNAYYNEEGNLETLPNIDINIKCGNSLISRFNLDADLSEVMTKNDYSKDKYLIAVQSYKRASDKESKSVLKHYIDDIKSQFKVSLFARDPRKKEMSKYRGQLNLLENASEMGDLFGKLVDKEVVKNKKKLLAKIEKLEASIASEEDGKFYDENNAFEWRFEFPEVLDDEGGYRGFDVVIGNPPYIRQEEFSDIKEYLKGHYRIYNSIADLLTYFVELGHRLLTSNGKFQFIISNKFARANYGKSMRTFLLENTHLTHYLDFSGFAVFDEATVDAAILGYECGQASIHNNFTYLNIDADEIDTINFKSYVADNKRNYSTELLDENTWAFESEAVQKIKHKVECKGVPLKDWDLKINFGIKTGFNQAFIIDKETKDQLIQNDGKSAELIKPLLRGRDIQKYVPEFANLWLIGTFPSKNINIEEYPAIRDYLKSFGTRLEQSGEKGSRKKTSNKWFETQDNIAYWEDFEGEKIVWKRIGSILRFAYSDSSIYCLDSTCIVRGEKLKYLCLLMNSKLCKFELFRNSPKTGTGDLIISVQALNPLRIPIPNDEIERKIETLFDKLIGKIENKEEIKELEAEIDLLVYKLYDLTYEEVLIVDPTFEMSEDEYEVYNV